MIQYIKVIKGKRIQSEGVKEINEGGTYSFVTGKSVEKFAGQEQD